MSPVTLRLRRVQRNGPTGGSWNVVGWPFTVLASGGYRKDGAYRHPSHWRIGCIARGADAAWYRELDMARMEFDTRAEALRTLAQLLGERLATTPVRETAEQRGRLNAADQARVLTARLRELDSEAAQIRQLLEEIEGADKVRP